MVEPQPQVQRILLGMEIRRYREHAGSDAAPVLRRLDWTENKLSKIETGSATINAAEVELLIEGLKVPRAERDTFRQLAREARKRGKLGKVPDWARKYVGLEAGAEELFVFEESLIWGPFQTPAYTAATVERSVIADRDDADQMSRNRLSRRDRLLSPDGPEISVIFDESILRRVIGGPEIMRDQLDLLVKLSKNVKVTMQVLPYGSGAHESIGTSFTKLRLRAHQKELVYIEDLTSADYLDRETHLRTYRLVTDRLRVAALSVPESTRLLRQVIAQM